MVYRGEYDPYGNIVYEWGSAGLNTRKFTGYERDATGLDYANARMYGPGRGRFMQPDPIGLKSADLKRPLSFNRYTYVTGDPVNQVDPSGLLTIIIGGTGSGDPDWGQPGTDFWKAVSETFGEKAIVFPWSGTGVTMATLYLGIIDGGFRLADFINNYIFQDGEKLNIVAHSHGGNIVKVASNAGLNRQIDNLVNLGTPQNQDLDRLGFSTNINIVGNYCNVSSLADPIQFVGASPRQIYYTITNSYIAETYAEAASWAIFQGDFSSSFRYAARSVYYAAVAFDWYMSTKIDWRANNNVLLTSESHSELHTVQVWNMVKKPCGL